MHAPGVLIRYEAARTALAECRRVDEVKIIHDQAMALQLYAKQAKDTALIGYATEIRLRAERRAGELLKRMAKANGGQVNGRRKKDGSRAKPSIRPPTLTQIGISKTQSSRWQRLANVAPSAFEKYVHDAKYRAEQGISAASRNAA